MMDTMSKQYIITQMSDIHRSKGGGWMDGWMDGWRGESERRGPSESEGGRWKKINTHTHTHTHEERERERGRDEERKGRKEVEKSCS